MKRVAHTYNGNLLVHYDSPVGDSTALCGQDIVGDDCCGDVWDEAKPTTKRVNCEDCIMIRDHVRGVKK